MTSTGGPTAPLFSALGLLSNGAVDGILNPWTAANDNVYATQGTIGYLAALSGYNGTVSGYNGLGVGLAKREHLGHARRNHLFRRRSEPPPIRNGWTGQAYEGFQDPIALNNTITSPRNRRPSSSWRWPVPVWPWLPGSGAGWPPGGFRPAPAKKPE